MREVTVDELRDMAGAARDEIWDIAAHYGRSPKIYLHWSAGHYFQKKKPTKRNEGLRFNKEISDSLHKKASHHHFYMVMSD